MLNNKNRDDNFVVIMRIEKIDFENISTIIVLILILRRRNRIRIIFVNFDNNRRDENNYKFLHKLSLLFDKFRFRHIYKKRR